MPPYDEGVSHFARTNHRAGARLFGIRQSDRGAHIYVIGKTGAGKSRLIEAFARQDLRAGRGFALVDPHGDLVARLWAAMPAQQRETAIYFDATDPAQPYGYNPLRRVREDKIPLAVSGLLETFRKLWPDAWGVRMEHVLRNSLYALLEQDGAVLPDVLRLYADDAFRKSTTARLRNEVVRAFWREEFEHYPARLRAEAIAPIQNKLGALLSDPRLYRIFVQPGIDLHFRQTIDEGRVLLVNLAKGQIGEDSALVLGSLIVSTLGLAAFSRAEVPSDERRPFFLYLDEFHNFTTLSLVTMMSELRKFGLGLTLAHQYIHQLDPERRQQARQEECDADDREQMRSVGSAISREYEREPVIAARDQGRGYVSGLERPNGVLVNADVEEREHGERPGRKEQRKQCEPNVDRVLAILSHDKNGQAEIHNSGGRKKCPMKIKHMRWRRPGGCAWAIITRAKAAC
jgi:hypothetical protein